MPASPRVIGVGKETLDYVTSKEVQYKVPTLGRSHALAPYWWEFPVCNGVNCSCLHMRGTVMVMKDHLFGEYDTLT